MPLAFSEAQTPGSIVYDNENFLPVTFSREIRNADQTRNGHYTFALPRIFTFVTNQAHPTRAYLNAPLGLHLSNVVLPWTYFANAEVTIFTVSNGVMDFHDRGTGVRGVADMLTNITGTNLVVPQGTQTFSQKLDSYNRGDIWWRVTAVDASGNISSNPSTWQQVTVTGQGSTDVTNTTTPLTLTGTPSDLPAPTGVSAVQNTGKIDITWTDSPGATGYIIERSYQEPSQNAPSAADEYVEVSGLTQAEIPSGAIVTLKVVDFFNIGVPDVCPRVRGLGQYRRDYVQRNEDNQEFEPYVGQPPALGWDGYHTRFTFTGAGERFDFGAVYGGKLQAFYDVPDYNKTYRLTIVAKADKNTTINVIGFPGAGTFSVTTSWQTLNFDFQYPGGSLEGSNINLRELEATEACVFDIAYLVVHELGVDWRDINPAETWPVAKTYLRDHLAIKNRPRSYTQEQVCSAYLQQPLYQARQNNLLPWLQVEWPELCDPVFAGYIRDYLAAPQASGLPAALQRADHGQTTPWIDEFTSDRAGIKPLIFEAGNEMWNGAGGFEPAPSNVTDQVTQVEYSASQMIGIIGDLVVRNMTAGTYGPALAAKTEFYVGGRSSFPQFIPEYFEFATNVDFTGGAYYNGGWDLGDGEWTETGASFLAVLGMAKYREQNLIDMQANVAAEGLRLGAYEGGPGFQVKDSVPQEVVMHSVASATANLDFVLEAAVYGNEFYNYFTSGTRNLFNGSKRPFEGGGGRWPYGTLLMLHDATGGWSRVKKLTTAESPTRPSDGMRAIEAYMVSAVGDDTKFWIVAVNRNIDPSLLETDDPDYSAVSSGVEPVTVNTLLGRAATSRYFHLGDNYREHNRYRPGIRYEGNTDVNPIEVPDPLCVSKDFSWATGPSNIVVSGLQIDERFGATANGLQAGTGVIIELSGVT